MCGCGYKPEITLHYLLYCILYCVLRIELVNDICGSSPTLKNLSHEKLLEIILFGSKDFSFNTNQKLIKSTIKFLKTSERFLGTLI